MNDLIRVPEVPSAFDRPESVREWRREVLQQGLLPIIVVAGSRGKTTVAHLLRHMLRDQYRIATRNEFGVTIRDERQSGEIEPWKRVESMLEHNELDLAIWEIDWATARALDAGSRHAVLAITNVCANREECMIYGDARAAFQALPVLERSLGESGVLILNGEDYAVASLRQPGAPRTVMAGMGIDAPAMESHRLRGGMSAWLEGNALCLSSNYSVRQLGRAEDLPFALNGLAPFQLHNALTAAAAAYVMGVRTSTISMALRTFRSDIREIPGSFNLMYTAGIPTIIDRPAPSWFLRPVVRALRDFRQARLLTIVGEMTDLPEEDLPEVGRLIGRVSSALLVVTGRASDGYRWQHIRDGALRNEVPPVLLTYATEQAAFRKAIAMARPVDVMYVLSSAPERFQHLWPRRSGGETVAGANRRSSPE
jgi:UDP-N-acetylmuramyl tripeptide synthase